MAGVESERTKLQGTTMLGSQYGPSFSRTKHQQTGRSAQSSKKEIATVSRIFSSVSLDDVELTSVTEKAPIRGRAFSAVPSSRLAGQRHWMCRCPDPEPMCSSEMAPPSHSSSGWSRSRLDTWAYGRRSRCCLESGIPGRMVTTACTSK